MVYKEVCECCGNEVVAYRYRLNQKLVEAFTIFYRLWIDEKRAIKTAELELPNGVYSSFFKLAYFGLIEKEGTGWVATGTGTKFMKGVRIPEEIYVMGGITLDRKHPALKGKDFLLVSMFDYDSLDGKFEKKKYYQNQKGFSFKSLFKKRYA